MVHMGLIPFFELFELEKVWSPFSNSRGSKKSEKSFFFFFFFFFFLKKRWGCTSTMGKGFLFALGCSFKIFFFEKWNQTKKEKERMHFQNRKIGVWKRNQLWDLFSSFSFFSVSNKTVHQSGSTQNTRRTRRKRGRQKAKSFFFFFFKKNWRMNGIQFAYLIAWSKTNWWSSNVATFRRAETRYEIHTRIHRTKEEELAMPVRTWFR